MFCPRCGTQDSETLRFCRQCGLSLAEITNFVATGGTASLQPNPNLPPETLTLRQKRILAVMASFFGPLCLGVFFAALFSTEDIIPFSMLPVPFLITLSVMYFNTRIRHQEKMQTASQPLPSMQPQAMPQQAYVPPPQAYLQAAVMPVNPMPSANVPRTTPNTNPLAHQPASVPASVVEDETKRFSGQR